jgi:hypothetical protein
MPDRCECHDEVARLHRLFQDWFRGALDVDEFSACEQALAPGFTIITPSGEIIDRVEIIDAIRRHRGGEPDHFEIKTVPRSCQRVRGLHISTYEEHQTGTRSTIRVSTAVIDGSLRWHNVHETWMTTTAL